MLVRTLGAPIEYWLNPEDYTEALEQRLLALDRLRFGDVLEALDYLHTSKPTRQLDAAEDVMRKYQPLLQPFVDNVLLDRRKRRQRFMAIMQTMRRDLERAGL